MTKPSTNATAMAQLVRQRQNDIALALTKIDNSTYREDCWERPGGGGGITRIIQSDVFEKAGVNSSEVFGDLTLTEQPMFHQLIQRVAPNTLVTDTGHFYATGISLVVHPKNPHVPTVHANYRYFEITLSNNEQLWWMGGGADLTPYYLYHDDATHFHTVHQRICDDYNPAAYPKFKTACDDYFYLPHRKETRGIGGIFFDYLNHDFNALFGLASTLSKGFIDAYVPIVNQRYATPYTPAQRHWQCLRRGRYAEFNLLHDRGTLFGLKTNGRIESILMSMPPEARWDYNVSPTPHSPEGELMAILKAPKVWVTP
ncbi:MAG: oxygen-dependent coproporphyrinogen oxidase [Candidatus Marinamargulisbacteria bacterium]